MTDARRRLAIAGLALALAGPGVAQAAQAPSAIDQARSGVIQVVKTAGGEKGAAFAIDRHGDFLTTQQSVSRSAGLEVRLPGSRTTYRAQRVESDAPPGLVVIRVAGAPAVAPLTFARSVPKPPARVWLAAPAAAAAHARSGKVQLAQQYCTVDGNGLLTIGLRPRTGINGSPVLDAGGRVVAVVRGSRFTRNCGDDATIQAVAATATPRPLPAFVPARASDFPAVAVVLAVLGVLLVINLVLWLRRLRGAAPVASASPADAAAPPQAPRYDDGFDDDLEIALKPKPGRA